MDSLPHTLKTLPVPPSDYRRKAIGCIVLVTVLKLFFAFYLELGNDEAYYWLYSRQLQWNYFDHPPMVAVWIRLFTLNNLLEAYSGFIRLGSVMGSALAAWFLYRTVALLHSERAGWMAVLLYTASFYAGITAGLYILPDSPQMVFWTASLWAIARLMKDTGSTRNWIVFGLLSGVCIMCKVHGVFLWVGLGGYILFYQRSLLRKPQLYLSFFITLVVISPIFFWNLEYDFITYRFHSSRVTVHEFILLWKSFLRETASQLCFNNPVNVVLTLLALSAWKRRKFSVPPASAALRVYTFTAFPLALILLAISLFRDTTLPHWSGPAYVSLLPLTAIYLSERTHRFFPFSLRYAHLLFWLVLVGWTLMIKFYPGTWGSGTEAEQGRGDISLDMYGWREAGEQFAALYRKEIALGHTPPNTPLVATHWWGAHVDYYFARPLHLPLIGLGQPEALNHYLWINRAQDAHAELQQAFCVIPSDQRSAVPSGYFARTEKLGIIHILRQGRPAHDFTVYRLYGLQKPIPQIHP